jgi:hypothetical protein
VASGLSIAKVTGSMLNNSLKLKALLNEAKDSPRNIKYMLEFQELLEHIISETIVEEGDRSANGNSTRQTVLPRLEQALHKALTTCQKAAEQHENGPSV